MINGAIGRADRNRVLERVERASRHVLILALVVAAGFTIHYFFRVVDRGVYLAVDEALANISVSLSELGRYGMLTMPMQYPDTTVRTHGFYNYGPAPFVLGAVLDWLFGTSYMVQRSLHPLGLIALSLLALAVFRRAFLPAGAVFAGLLIWIFWANHWPMARPDVTVSLFAGLGIAALTWAIRSNAPIAWGSAAFCISTAATTHQISAALVPATALVWALAQWLNAIDATDRGGFKRQRNLTLLACVLGGFLGLLVFAVAIEFRFGDLVRWYGEYLKILEPRSDGWWDAFRQHFRITWQPMNGRQLAGLAGGMALAGLLLAVAPWLHSGIRRRCIALLLPPLALCLAYQLSLGFYANYHSGYVILVHVTTFWTIAAALAALLVIIKARRPRIASIANSALSLVVGGLVIWVAVYPSDRLLAAARQNASGAEYLNHVIENLPQGAVVWGDPVFGIDTPARVQFVHTVEAARYTRLRKPDDRSELAPGFLVLGVGLLQATMDIVGNAGMNSESIFNQAPQLFPGTLYQLAKIVFAPPYGSTRIYKHVNASETPAPPPLVAVNDGGPDGPWRQALGEAVSFTSEAIPPISFDLRYFGRHASGVARDLVALTLPQGDYMIKAQLSNATSWGVLLAGDTPNPTQVSGDLPFDMAMAPYFPQDRVVYMLRRHPGGRMYVSQFSGDADASFELLEARPVTRLTPLSPPPRPLPPPHSWTVTAENGIGTRIHDALEVAGDASAFGYQLMSPRIPVEPQATVTVRVPIDVLEGSVRLGVLSQTGEQWIARQQSGHNEMVFNTGNNKFISIVVDNDNPGGDGDPSRFRAKQGSLSIDSGELYVDRLTACREWRDQNAGKPEYCD